ncbi:MAG: sulfurtransferase-like selenium metabolism protein YedF [Syntrophomonas sp.]
MKKTVDARGLSCPQPVILTKKALEEQGVSEILTIVDNPAAFENVSRLLESFKLTPAVEQKGDEYYINVSKDETVGKPDTGKTDGDTVVLISSNILGRGDDQLGGLLMKSFLYSLTQLEGVLKSVIFMNGGVLLTTEDSEVLEHIKLLEEKGIEVLSCGTCLDYYKVADKLQAGSVTNMYTITERMVESPRVISL